MTIQVYRDQTVLIRAPNRCKDDEIANFFVKHSAWVRRKLQESQQYPGLSASQYKHQGFLWLLGHSKPITVSTGTVNKVNYENDQLLITQHDPDDQGKTERQLQKWKRSFAERLFEERLEHWFKQFPVAPGQYQFKLRKMKRQWGNCNSRGVITINSQLIRYPLSCIDYVLAHELTHLKHMNHSQAFYHLLEKVMPDWQHQRQLLSRFSGFTAEP